jgi:hypothetical protein
MAHLVLPNGKGHGYKPDTFDPNDYPLSKVVHRKAIAAIQSTRSQIWLDPALLSKTRDQGQQGSCTGHGTVDALEWSFRFKHKKNLTLSPADAYLGGRIIEASIKEDSGCEIRDVIKAAANDGVCLNQYMPYSDQKLATKRTKISVRNARAHQVGVGYYRCDDNGTNREVTVDNMIRALDSNMPVVGGYSWLSCLDTSTFEQTGVMPAPFGKLEGGHCNDCVGVDIPSRVFLWHNSYGSEYGAKHPVSGQGGFVVMPFTWVLSGAADDMWAVRHE